MKLINSGSLLFAIATTLPFLANGVPTVIGEEQAHNSLTVVDSKGLIIPTVIRILDPTVCPAGEVPTYTNPKGGQVDCGSNGASTETIPVGILACTLVGCVLFGGLRTLA